MWGGRAERELADEVASHIEMQTEENLRAGMNEAEALRAARLKFGGPEMMKESYRDQRGLPFLDALFSDFRHALRGLRNSPGFTLVAVLTLAVGIGANTAVFSLVDQVLLRPSGIVEPERVVTVQTTYKQVNVEFIGGSYRSFADMKESPQVFEHVALVSGTGVSYTGGATPQRLAVAAVSKEYFDVFGAKPNLGRTFTDEEDKPNANHVVVLSYGTWRQSFGGDPGVLGRSIELDQVPHRIVGVMGPELTLGGFNLYLPLGLPQTSFTEAQRFNENAEIVARTRKGVTAQAANEWMRVLTQRVHDSAGQGKIAKESQWRISLVPIVERMAGATKAPLLALLGAVGLVLLIACTNIAGLLLARASARGREFAVRAALGASRGQLLRAVFAESLLLAAIGGAAGVAVAYGGVQILLAVAPQDVAGGLRADLNVMVLLFCAGAASVSALLFGLAPAWQVSQLAPTGALGGEGRSTTVARDRQWTRSALVVTETALALVLLVASGLFLRSFVRLQAVDPGFNPKGVMTARFSLPIKGYPRGGVERRVFYRTLLDRLQATPGVTSAALGSVVPFLGGNDAGNFEILGRVLKPGEIAAHGDERGVSPGYFATMGIPLKRGRLFTEQDQIPGEHVMVIDEALANQYWPGEDPIDKRVRRIFDYRIIGVVGHAMHFSLNADTAKGTYYYSTYQRGIASGQILLKTAGDPSQMSSAIREAVREADPRLAVDRFISLEDGVAQSLGARRFGMQLVGFFAGTGLFLATLGLYGVISYSVAQRTREIGIRMALGAEKRTVLTMVLGRGLRLAAIGTVLGLAGAIAVGRLIQSQLYGVTLFDPLTLGSMIVVLLIAALLASYLPARRAVRIDPAVALRPE
jgi:predicted permease